MSNALSDAWNEAGRASIVSETLPVELRAWLKGWAAGAEQLTGSTPPASVSRPGSWNAGETDDTAGQALNPEETLRQIRGWEAWYESAPFRGTGRVSLDVLAGRPDGGRLPTWDELVTSARNYQFGTDGTRAAEVAYLTAVRSRWADALQRAAGASFLARGTLTEAAQKGETAERRWWGALFDSRARGAGPAEPGPIGGGAPPPPPTPEEPPEEPPQEPRRFGTFGKLAIGAAATAVAYAVTRKRKRRR